MYTLKESQMSEEKDLPEVKADKKASKKEEVKLEVAQPVQSPKSGACSCGCQEKLQKLIEAVASNKLIKIELQKLGLI